jgi:hypothetical protein
MCCFSPVYRDHQLVPIHVSQTRIFARMVAPSVQALIYELRLDAPEPVAMILPLPTQPAAGEAGLTFVDLGEYPFLFADLELCFEAPSRQDFGAPQPASAEPTLVMHRVGAFEASFAPSQKDLDRLDPRFRMPAGIWDAIGGYEDYGFAVFQLAAGDQRVHPMAFTFRTREPGSLFFPTVHVHDGAVHAQAAFDHALYAQGARVAPGDAQGLFPPSSFVAIDDAKGLVDGALPLSKRTLRGMLPNRDTRLPLA